MRSSQSATDALFGGNAGYAHRGLHGPGVPENSIAAFHAAIAAGAGIECDLRLSSDGVPMVFHDATLDRLCGVDRKTESVTATELRGLRLADSSEPIPCLSDLLAIAVEIPLLLELKKGPGPIEPLCAAVAEAIDHHPGPVGVMSYEAGAGLWFARHRPALARGLVIRRPPARLRNRRIRIAEPDFVAVALRSIARPWVADLRAAGIPVGCWTVRSAVERRQVALHADVLIWEGDGRP